MLNHLQVEFSDFVLYHYNQMIIVCIVILILTWLITVVKFFQKPDKSFFTISIVFILPILLVWTFYVEQQMLVSTKITIPIKNLPTEFENYKIVFISDPHTCIPYTKLEKIKRVARLANKQKPDLLILGGDYEVTEMILSKSIATKKTAKILKAINAKDGKYAILGNHDCWNCKSKIIKQLKENGFTVLVNKSTNIGTSKAPLFLVGLGDFDFGDTDFSTLIKLPKTSPIIAVVHEPDAFPLFPENIDLTLSGHTHGGQIRLPFIGALKTPSAYGNKYSKGLIKEGKKQLFVSSGVGTSILPIRFCNPPEIVVITLKRAKP